eukprot:1650151-Rhodomonas_salina.1
MAVCPACPVLAQHTVALPFLTRPIPLPACYAMPGTATACGGSCLRACYAMPGTELAYGATRGQRFSSLGARRG